jgi:DNA-binding NarL/FixJ family response regulator
MVRTLIVEDSVIFRQALKQMLWSKFPGMSIEEAANGSEALEKTSVFSPDIVFMDIRLPGESGLVITKKIKMTDWIGKIIVLTSHELPEYMEAAYSAGADHFLIKGAATGEEIASLIESILAERSTLNWIWAPNR